MSRCNSLLWFNLWMLENKCYMLILERVNINSKLLKLDTWLVVIGGECKR